MLGTDARNCQIDSHLSARKRVHESRGRSRPMQISGKQSLSPVRVYVVAENRLLRETLVRLFRKRSDICIVGDNCCSDSAIENIASAKSALLLLDCFNTNHRSELWLAGLRESIPEIKIVLFGMDEDPAAFLRA